MATAGQIEDLDRPGHVVTVTYQHPLDVGEGLVAHRIVALDRDVQSVRRFVPLADVDAAICVSRVVVLVWNAWSWLPAATGPD